ncbi:MAG TPA: adenylosuccinate synthetase [Nitrososphaerales archaeon]|nr:adenylosuccinate synthetase [Nitrososphaerales archaeon]
MGLQWGDEGKGKVVDYLAGEYDAVARFNGGSNAGHTVVIGGKKHTFHLIPSGALKGKELLIGAGVAVDPIVLGEELSLLPDEVKRRLVVDDRCSLVSPMDKQLDAVLEEMKGPTAIGTTRRGIGPSYATRALRLSPRVSDLLRGFDFAALVRFYEKLSVDSAGLASWSEESKRLLTGIVGSASARINAMIERGGSVLFEGSQGTLLDLIHGSYPFVTGTHTTASYIPASLGIPPSSAGESLGVMKCYATRVGSGPFPTEVKGPVADSIRSIGNEYGATTGRPRRVGWLDLVALRYSIALNGSEKVVVSKVDVLSQIRDFKVCVAYKHQGSESADFQSSLAHLDEVEPVYESPFSLHGARYESGLPEEGKKLVAYLEKVLRVSVSMVSHGEERSMTIEL